MENEKSRVALSLKVNTKALDEVIKKAKRITDLVEEAKMLAEDLASQEIAVEFEI